MNSVVLYDNVYGENPITLQVPANEFYPDIIEYKGRLYREEVVGGNFVYFLARRVVKLD